MPSEALSAVDIIKKKSYVSGYIVTKATLARYTAIGGASRALGHTVSLLLQLHARIVRVRGKVDEGLHGREQ